MNLKTILFTLLIVLTVSLTGCAYELSDENLLNLDKPASTHPIDLSLISASDTIKISQKQLINYTIDTYGLTLKTVEFKLGAYLLGDMTASSGTITIDPTSMSNGLYDLTMDVTTNSGTGSLADKLGGEGYLAQRSWKVKISGQTTTTGGGTTPVDTTIDNSPTIPIKNIKSVLSNDGCWWVLPQGFYLPVPGIVWLIIREIINWTCS